VLRHQLILRDGLLHRMLPGRSAVTTAQAPD
jgi:hypothetical protein